MYVLDYLMLKMNCKKNKNKNIILIYFQTKYKIIFIIISNKLLAFSEMYFIF
jgi:hypothetical protein